MEMIKLVGIGLVLGMMTVVPGVSVGTLMVMFGIYDRIIEIISPNIKKIIAAWKFWLPLLVTIIIGLFLSFKVIDSLFKTYRIQTCCFLIGIILGSIPLIYKRVRKPDSKLPSLPSIICCLIALAIMIAMVIFRPAGGTDAQTVITVGLFVMLFLGGALAAIAMIIPGISGSFMLLAIGLYETIIEAGSNLNFAILLPVALGTIAGILAGAALVRFLLAKAPRETYAAILGLVAGSILVIYQKGELKEATSIIIPIICIIAGGALSFFMGKQGKSAEVN